MKQRIRDREWEVEHSSLFKNKKGMVTYQECREYACADIANNLTNISKERSSVIELPVGTDFHFLGRVYTGTGELTPERYYEQFKNRKFVSFSSINRKNVSHYRGEAFFVYDILPEDIVHIFPLDSDTDRGAIEEEELTYMPSLWLTLSELENITYELGTYNQITCKTDRNGEILKPFAIVVFDEASEWIQKIASQFGVSLIILHPDEDAIKYNEDLLYDCSQLNGIARKMDRLYGLYEVTCLFYPD